VLPSNLTEQVFDIFQIAALLKLADPTSDRPAELLEAAEGVIDQLPPYWVVYSGDIGRAAIATIRGDSEAALQWLNSAWDKRWRTDWRNILLDDVVFSQLATEPGYQELVARFEADMDQQRQLAYELLDIRK